MANQANIKAVITAEDKASGVIKGFGDQVETSQKGITKSISSSAIAVGAATAGIVAFGKKSLDAWNAQDLATVRLQAGINNVKSATDKHIDSLIKQAAALQKTTRFSDEAIISAQGILSTFQLNQKAITAITPRLIDMSEGLARVTGEMPDLEGNAIQVAKAIGGEDVAGLTGTLRKAGVVLTKTQEQLLQTGTVEQRIATITQVLDQNFKDMGTAAGGTTAGKIAELKNQFNDLQEKIGQTIAIALTPLLNILLAHPAILTAVTGALGLLTSAFVTTRVAGILFGSEMASISAVLGGLSAATGIAQGSLLALSSLSLLGWAGGIVAAFVMVRNSALATADAVNSAWQAAQNLAPEAQMRQLQKQAAAARALGDTAAVNKYANAIAALGGGRAFGGQVMPGQAYPVGEYGREIFVPNQPGQIVPESKMGGGQVNLSVNVGVYTGSEIEKRKLAQELLNAMKDIASSKGKTVNQLLGA